MKLLQIVATYLLTAILFLPQVYAIADVDRSKETNTNWFAFINQPDGSVYAYINGISTTTLTHMCTQLLDADTVTHDITGVFQLFDAFGSIYYDPANVSQYDPISIHDVNIENGTDCFSGESALVTHHTTSARNIRALLYDITNVPQDHWTGSLLPPTSVLPRSFDTCEAIVNGGLQPVAEGTSTVLTQDNNYNFVAISGNANTIDSYGLLELAKLTDSDGRSYTMHLRNQVEFKVCSGDLLNNLIDITLDIK